jgi:hypothetical protein
LKGILVFKDITFLQSPVPIHRLLGEMSKNVKIAMLEAFCERTGKGYAMNVINQRSNMLLFCQFRTVEVGLGLFLAVHAAENVCSQMYYRASEN